MIRRLLYGSPVGMATFLPLDWEDHDKISRKVKTAQDFENREEINETGPDRIKRMFSIE